SSCSGYCNHVVSQGDSRCWNFCTVANYNFGLCQTYCNRNPGDPNCVNMEAACNLIATGSPSNQNVMIQFAAFLNQCYDANSCQFTCSCNGGNTSTTSTSTTSPANQSCVYDEPNRNNSGYASSGHGKVYYYCSPGATIQGNFSGQGGVWCEADIPRFSKPD